MNEISFQEALKIIERTLKTVKNPRILELILEILQYNVKVEGTTMEVE